MLFLLTYAKQIDTYKAVIALSSGCQWKVKKSAIVYNKHLKKLIKTVMGSMVNAFVNLRSDDKVTHKIKKKSRKR